MIMENFINGVTPREATVEAVSKFSTPSAPQMLTAEPPKPTLRDYLLQYLGVIIKLSQLKANGKKLGLIKANRVINPANLKKKVVSIKENGLLMPIVIVPGEALLDEGVEISDFATGEDVSAEEMKNYVAIIEGQHRTKAVYQINEEAGSEVIDPVLMYALPSNISNVSKLMAAVNSEVFIWDGKDYVRGAYLKNNSNELLAFAHHLSNIKSTKGEDNKPKNGYSLSTISLYCCFNDNLTKQILARSMDEGCEILPSSDIERANKILERASRIFNHKYLSKRYFIEWVIDEFTKRGSNIDEVLSLLDKVTQSNADDLYNTKLNGDITKIREIIYRANEIVE